MDERIARRLLQSLSDAIRIAYDGHSVVHCPHCGIEKTLPVVPLSPVMVCECVECGGYVIPFAGELVGIQKSAIDLGTEEDKKFAIVQAIMNVLYQAVRSLIKKKGGGEEVGGSDEIPDGI